MDTRLEDLTKEQLIAELNVAIEKNKYLREHQEKEYDFEWEINPRDYQNFTEMMIKLQDKCYRKTGTHLDCKEIKMCQLQPNSELFKFKANLLVDSEKQREFERRLAEATDFLKANGYEVRESPKLKSFTGPMTKTPEGGWDETIRTFMVKVVHGEDLLLVEVLQEHLGRFIIEDDLRDCQMAFMIDKPDEYQFSYKGVLLGKVVRDLTMGYDLALNIFTIRREVRFYKIHQP